jgi:hypothetical protein
MRSALTFDDIKVGNEMTPYTRKFRQENVDIVMVMEGTAPNWHIDPSHAQAVSDWNVKKDCTVLPGIMTEMGVSEFMVNWLGGHKAWFCGGSMDIKFVAPVQIHVKEGGEVRYKGKVVEKKIENGKKCMICEIHAEQEGKRIMNGTVKVIF